VTGRPLPKNLLQLHLKLVGIFFVPENRPGLKHSLGG